MQYLKFANDTAIQFTASTTAKTVYDYLIDAGETPTTLQGLSAVEINPEGDIRYTLNGNVPTTTKGMRLLSGETRLVRGDSIDKIYIVAESGTPVINIQAGKVN